jgi:sulfoxide reductase heme-binding subunit YedZ
MSALRILPRRTVDPPEVDGALAGALLVSGGAVITGMLLASVLFGWSPSPASWYIARASGLTLYLLTWFNLLTGLGLTTRLMNDTGGRAVVYSVHAYAFHLWYGFLTLHVLSLAIDPTEDFGARELLVPFASGVREPWTGLGVIAAELTVVIGASFGARRLIGFRAWRAMHWLTFPVFAIGLAHGIGAGTDSSSLAIQLLYLGTAASVIFLATYRILRRRERRTPRGDVPKPAAPYDRLTRADPHPRSRRY